MTCNLSAVSSYYLYNNKRNSDKTSWYYGRKRNSESYYNLKLSMYNSTANAGLFFETGKPSLNNRDTNKLYSQMKEHVKETNEMCKETIDLFKETNEHCNEINKNCEETNEHFKETNENRKETIDPFKETNENCNEINKNCNETNEHFKETNGHFKINVDFAFNEGLYSPAAVRRQRALSAPPLSDIYENTISFNSKWESPRISNKQRRESLNHTNKNANNSPRVSTHNIKNIDDLFPLNHRQKLLTVHSLETLPENVTMATTRMLKHGGRGHHGHPTLERINSGETSLYNNRLRSWTY